MRAVVTSLAHASFAGVFGVAIGLRRTAGAGRSLIIWSFVAAALLHGAYDSIIVLHVLPPFTAIVLIYGVYSYVRRHLRAAARS